MKRLLVCLVLIGLLVSIGAQERVNTWYGYPRYELYSGKGAFSIYSPYNAKAVYIASPFAVMDDFASGRIPDRELSDLPLFITGVKVVRVWEYHTRHNYMITGTWVVADCVETLSGVDDSRVFKVVMGGEYTSDQHVREAKALISVGRSFRLRYRMMNMEGSTEPYVTNGFAIWSIPSVLTVF
jgi:hypothetical protein